MSRRSRWPAALLASALGTLFLILYAVRRDPESVIVVTPTHDALSRFAHITVLAQSLPRPESGVKVLWLVVEDAAEQDSAVRDLLEATGIDYRYLAVQTPTDATHRGVAQRNGALEWILREQLAGVVYFADDDNAYRAALWSHLARMPLDSFTVFPVGNMGYFGWEGPILAEAAEGKARIEQWSCDFCPRRWNVDMSGFAFGTETLRRRPDLRFDPASVTGYLETDFLAQVERTNATLVCIPDLVGSVHVWHNHGVPFHGAAFYDAAWTTDGTAARRMKHQEDLVIGFTWSEPDLPLAIPLDS